MQELLDFLDKYNVQHSTYHHHSRPGWVQVQECYNCHSNNFHLGLKLDGTRASCYRCGGKNMGKALKALTDAPWHEIRKIIGQGAFLSPEPETPCGVYTPPTCLVPLTGKIEKYVKGRGIHPDYASRVWGCMGTGPFSDYPFRLFIPIKRRKRPVSWTARATSKTQTPRYQTAMKHQKSFDEKRMLFGSDFARGSVVIVEGPLGAIKIGPGTVATCGVAYTQAQLSLMADYPRRFICFDSEDAAQARAQRLAADLAVFPGETSIVVLDAADPGEITRAECRSLRRMAFGDEDVFHIFE